MLHLKRSTARHEALGQFEPALRPRRHRVHWGMAAALVVLTLLGLYMVGLPDVGFDPRRSR